jgi:hypothetical protein
VTVYYLRAAAPERFPSELLWTPSAGTTARRRPGSAKGQDRRASLDRN